MMKRLLIALLVSGIGFSSGVSVLADDPKENTDKVKKAEEATKDDEEEKPESKPVEGQKLKLQKANGGAIDIEIRGIGAGQIRIAPGGMIRVLPGMPPKVQKAGKAKDDDKEKEEDGDEKKADEKDGDKKDDDKKTAEDKKTTEDKIAAFMKKREVEARKPRAEQMQRRIEELEEIVGLEDGQQKKLEIASKGAVEKSLEPWREQMDNYIRQYLERSPNNVDAMLASIGNVNFGHTPEQQAAEQNVWLATIGRVLNKQQMATYQQTVDERNKYLHGAVSSLLIADLDRNLRLTAEQREKLAGLLRPVIEENLTLLGRWSNDGNLPVYQLPTLLGGVEEKALKKVLSEKQIEGWQARFARFKNMWQSMEQQKENKREEEEAKKKEEAEEDEEGDKAEEAEAGEEGKTEMKAKQKKETADDKEGKADMKAKQKKEAADDKDEEKKVKEEKKEVGAPAVEIRAIKIDVIGGGC